MVYGTVVNIWTFKMLPQYIKDWHRNDFNLLKVSSWILIKKLSNQLFGIYTIYTILQTIKHKRRGFNFKIVKPSFHQPLMKCKLGGCLLSSGLQRIPKNQWPFIMQNS